MDEQVEIARKVLEREAQDAWADWLRRMFPGSPLFTLTFRDDVRTEQQPSLSKARKAVERFKEMARGFGWTSMWFEEYGKAEGRRHYHGLMCPMQPTGMAELAMATLLGWWEVEQGFTQVSQKGGSGAADYAAKYAAKEGGWACL